jgi:putative nucleotidyltransferase-like protein
MVAGVGGGAASRADILVTLVVDAVTGRVVRALDGAGVASLVLRGPAFVYWLYDRPADRTYTDLDLLVTPGDFERARATLRAIGFSPVFERWPAHAEAWLPRDEWGAPVDLHRRIALASARADEVWRILRAGAIPRQVGGAEVWIPGRTSVALLAALHAAHHGDERPHLETDLARALERLDLDSWQEAAALAAALGATPGFASGLRQLPYGRALAARLGLTTKRPVEVALREDGAPAHALVVENLVAASGLRARLRIVSRALFPPAGQVRAGSRLASRGPLGLGAAYVWRAVRLMPAALPSVLAWRRARSG